MYIYIFLIIYDTIMWCSHWHKHAYRRLYDILLFSYTHTQTRPSHLVPSWLFVQVCKDASTRASAALVSAGTASSLLAAKKARSFVISSWLDEISLGYLPQILPTHHRICTLIEARNISFNSHRSQPCWWMLIKFGKSRLYSNMTQNIVL